MWLYGVRVEHQKDRSMLNLDFMLIYVKDAPESRAFYADLLGREPVEESPNFALFVLESGLKLGMWNREKVEPAATMQAGGAELVFGVDDSEAVDAIYRDWSARNIPIAMAPVLMDFGRTFVALDPDGHRLRVFAPSNEANQ
jgi:catechol 2,3-dioxygenase-like lactoylglutathione lyase family enzyme